MKTISQREVCILTQCSGMYSEDQLRTGVLGNEILMRISMDIFKAVYRVGFSGNSSGQHQKIYFLTVHARMLAHQQQCTGK